MPHVSVVVPTFRGAESLGELLSRLRTTMADRGIDHEVIVVNDASPDDTWDRLEKLAPEHPELVAVDLLGNRGQALATLAGLAHSRGDLVATMDDDLQQPPEELGKLLDALDAHPRWDAAVGTWARDHGWFRAFGSWIHAVVDKLSNGTPMTFRHTSFRVIRRRLVEALLDHQSRTPVLGPMLRQLSSEVHNVEVAHAERRHGTSTMTLRETLGRVVTNLIHGTTLPLRLLSRLGLLASVAALVLGSVFLVRWAVGSSPPPGWTSSFLATTFFGGILLLGIGLLGEYMSVVVREVRRPPRWSVRSVLRSDDSD